MRPPGPLRLTQLTRSSGNRPSPFHPHLNRPAKTRHAERITGGARPIHRLELDRTTRFRAPLHTLPQHRIHRREGPRLPAVPLGRRHRPALRLPQIGRVAHVLPGVDRIEPGLPLSLRQRIAQRRDIVRPLRRQHRVPRPLARSTRQDHLARSLPRQQRQHLVKARGMRARHGLLRRPVEPRQMRQQQPRIEPPPHRHLLAVVEHGLLHPIECPRRQHFLHMRPRQHQSRRPPLRENAIPPPEHVGRLPAHPHPRRRRAHIALLRKMMQKPHLALSRPPIVKVLPGTGRGTIRRMVEGTRPIPKRQIDSPRRRRRRRRRQNARAIALALPKPSVSARQPRSALPAGKALAPSLSAVVARSVTDTHTAA